MAEQQLDLFRNDTTRCTRVKGGDRRTPRGRAFREILSDQGGRIFNCGRRAYDRGDHS